MNSTVPASPSDETRKVIQSPLRQLTEYQLAHAALQAAICSQDKAGIDAARIWIAHVQMQQRQAHLLLLEHVVEKAGRKPA